MIRARVNHQKQVAKKQRLHQMNGGTVETFDPVKCTEEELYTFQREDDMAEDEFNKYYEEVLNSMNTQNGSKNQ